MRYKWLILLFLCVKLMAQDSIYEFDAHLPVYYGQMKSAVKPSMALAASDCSFALWQDKAHDKLLELAGPFPPDADFAPEVIATEQRNGYTAQKIAINISAWNRISLYLLVPDALKRDGTLKLPAVIMLHDHGAHFSIGKEKMVRPIGATDEIKADAEQWTERCYDSRFLGDELAAQGYVVIAADAPYFGERGARGGSRYVDQQAIASNIILMGYSWAGLTLHDDMRTLAFLQTLPYVDALRIGAFGFSFGAYRAWMLAAASRKLAAVVSVCWMSSVRELIEPQNNITRGQTSFSMYIPRLNHYLDFPDIAAIASPTPCMYIQGTADRLFTTQSVAFAFNTLEKAYEGCPTNLVTILDNDGHTVSAERRQQAFSFLEKILKQH